MGRLLHTGRRREGATQTADRCTVDGTNSQDAPDRKDGLTPIRRRAVHRGSTKDSNLRKEDLRCLETRMRSRIIAVVNDSGTRRKVRASNPSPTLQQTIDICQGDEAAFKNDEGNFLVQHQFSDGRTIRVILYSLKFEKKLFLCKW